MLLPSELLSTVLPPVVLLPSELLPTALPLVVLLLDGLLPIKLLPAMLPQLRSFRMVSFHPNSF